MNITLLSVRATAEAFAFGSTIFSRKRIGKVIDWSKVDKGDYLLAMECNPTKDVEIKVLLKNALTGEINSREVYI